MGRYFGTDGIRDVAGQGLLAPAEVHRVARAIGQRLVEQPSRSGNGYVVFVGRDTRESGSRIAQQMAAGLAEYGVAVRDLGVLPTPGVAYLTRTQRADLGLVISASHNPAADNGIKVFDTAGAKASETVEHDLENRIDALPLAEHVPDVGELPSARELVAQYEDFLVHVAGGDGALDGLSVVLDCAHGAAYDVAPRVWRRLGARVHGVGIAPDGRNINDGAGALSPGKLAPVVREQGAALGFSFDGDADRLIALDETGQVRDGDDVLAVWGRHLHEHGRLPNATVVGTVMANLGLERSLADAGIRLERTPVGDKHVAARMREGGFALGGEPSGHVCYFGDEPEPATTGDGLLTALHVARVVRDAGAPLSLLSQVLTRLPQVLRNVPVREMPPLETVESVHRAVREAEDRLAGRGRILLRYSGTEPKARVMVEGDDLATIEGAAESIVAAIRSALGTDAG